MAALRIQNWLLLVTGIVVGNICNAAKALYYNRAVVSRDCLDQLKHVGRTEACCKINLRREQQQLYLDC